MTVKYGQIPSSGVPIDRGELKRRLGGDFESTLKKYSEGLSAHFGALEIKYSVGEAELFPTESGICVGDTEIRSSALARLISGCKKCAVLALTLGLGTDRFIKRCSAKSDTLGFVCDAYASALCDSACLSLCKSLSLCNTAPFAPGYADTDTACLPALLKIADPSGTLGITFTDSTLMLPTKSIIVIVGKM
jgi:hypothetical protein